MSLPPSSVDVPRVTIRDETLLSDNWGRLTRYEIDFRRGDGRIEAQTREVYDRGEGAVILLYDRDRGTVVLTRQFRLPAFMTPGSVTERLHFFIAPYEAGMKISEGGGEEAEGEDIEVLEMTLVEALEMVRSGEIRDAKTIMLLQQVALAGFMDGKS